MTIRKDQTDMRTTFAPTDHGTVQVVLETDDFEMGFELGIKEALEIGRDFTDAILIATLVETVKMV